MKVFISQPMKDLSQSQIKEARENLERYAKDILGSSAEFIDSFVKQTPPPECQQTSVWYLGQSLCKLAEADALVIPKRAEETNNGCRIEKLVAQLYGIDVVAV